jgi:hypothetical protein
VAAVQLTFDDEVTEAERADVGEWAARQVLQALWVNVRASAISMGAEVGTLEGRSVIVRRRGDLLRDLDDAYEKAVATLA